MRYSHGSCGLVAPLHAAMLAECDVGSSVNQRLVGVVIVREQALLELAFVVEDCLEATKRQDMLYNELLDTNANRDTSLKLK